MLPPIDAVVPLPSSLPVDPMPPTVSALVDRLVICSWPALLVALTLPESEALALIAAASWSTVSAAAGRWRSTVVVREADAAARGGAADRDLVRAGVRQLELVAGDGRERVADGRIDVGRDASRVSVAGDVDGDRRAAVDVGRLDGQRAGRCRRCWCRCREAGVAPVIVSWSFIPTLTPCR